MERGNRSSGRYYGPEGGEEADHEYRHRRSSYQQFFPVFRIHDMLVWIRIRGSMPLTNGSGIDLQDANKKTILSLFEGRFTSFFKDKNSKRSNKTVGIKVFLTIFA